MNVPVRSSMRWTSHKSLICLDFSPFTRFWPCLGAFARRPLPHFLKINRIMRFELQAPSSASDCLLHELPAPEAQALRLVSGPKTCSFVW